MKTRFKMWWRLVGAAVEHAASLANPDREVDFEKLFLARDDDDEDSTSLADTLEIMLQKWSGQFEAADVAKFINIQAQTDQYGAPRAPDPSALSLREFLYPGAPAIHMATPKSVGKLLKKHADETVKARERTLILRKHEDSHTKKWTYFIQVAVVQ
jgi:hypothetical protein